jgi:hypothetical protein
MPGARIMYHRSIPRTRATYTGTRMGRNGCCVPDHKTRITSRGFMARNLQDRYDRMLASWTMV